MKRFFARPGSGHFPGRVQNLLISPSKHFYLTTSGKLRWQQKAIDPRLPGTKSLLVRLVLLDVDSGTLYGEMHRVDDQDVLGFLARAWSVKRDHPMRGIPQQLNVPKAMWADASIREEILELSDAYDIEIEYLPPGFSAGIHAVKNFEKSVREVAGGADDLGLGFVQFASAIISSQASGESHMWDKDWYAIEGPDENFNSMIDQQYEPVGSWRMGPYATVIHGMEHKD